MSTETIISKELWRPRPMSADHDGHWCIDMEPWFIFPDDDLGLNIHEDW